MKVASFYSGFAIVLQLVAGQAQAHAVNNRQVCGWEGHCSGATCTTENDCDGDLICRSGRCANPNAVGGGAGGGGGGGRRPTTTRRPTPTPTSTRGAGCEWEGHCLGDACDTENDCDGDLTCRSGRCANPSGSIPSTTRRPTFTIGPTVTLRPTSTRRPTTTRRPTNTPRPTPTPTPTSAPGTCEWDGHCLGDACAVDEDCDGVLGCQSGRCAEPADSGAEPTSIGILSTVTLPDSPEATGVCGVDFCIGASCATDANCGDNLLICRNGRCSL